MKNRFQAILFDLDGTLIHNDMDEFLPPYFKLVARRFAHILPPAQFTPKLIQATQAMIADESDASNREVFKNSFPDLIGRPWHEIEPIFMDFYARDFPALSMHIRPKAAARPLLLTALDLGYTLVVSTNPLFPLQAIQQRLDWGGIGDLPYARVTSYENSRACKPSLRYFEQILAEIDCPPERALVVGDENNDMVAAHLGCSTYLIPGPATDLAPTTPEPAHRGTLADVMALLQAE